MVAAVRLWTVTWFALTFTALWCVSIGRSDLAFPIAVLATLVFGIGVVHVSWVIYVLLTSSRERPYSSNTH